MARPAAPVHASIPLAQRHPSWHCSVLVAAQGAWAELLGFGDFYYELGVQAVEACWATRPHNGGMMELAALLRYVNRRRGSLAQPISEDDVVRAGAALAGAARMHAHMQLLQRELACILGGRGGP